MKKNLIFSFLSLTLLSTQLSAISFEGSYVQLNGNFLKKNDATKVSLNTKRGIVSFEKDWQIIGKADNKGAVGDRRHILSLPADAKFSNLADDDFNLLTEKIAVLNTKGESELFDGRSSEASSHAAALESDKIIEGVVSYGLAVALNATNSGTQALWSSLGALKDDRDSTVLNKSVYKMDANDKLTATVSSLKQFKEYFDNFESADDLGSSANDKITTGNKVSDLSYAKLKDNGIITETDIIVTDKMTKKQDTFYGGSLKVGTAYKQFLFEGGLELNRIDYLNTDNVRVFHTNNFQASLNAYYAMDFGSILVPYVGGGIGLNYSDIVISNPNNKNVEQSLLVENKSAKKRIKTTDIYNLEESYDFVYNVNAGVNLNCTQSLALDLNYKFIAPFDSKGFEYKVSNQVDDFGNSKTVKLYNSFHVLSMGIKYLF